VRTSVPEVAVTVMVKVPAGVPLGLTVGPLAQPEMYLAEIISKIRAAAGIRRRASMRLKFARAIPASRSASAEIIVHDGNDLGVLGVCGPNGLGTFVAEVRDVVVIVSVVLVPADTDDGLNVAAAPAGNPDAVNVMGVGKVPAIADVVIV
jgi:hypothetical protein